MQLKTRTKAFCGCSTEFGSEPNSQTCPVCLGFPGSLPVLNRTAFEYAIKVALSLNCTVQEYTKFDRKNYFYPDLPKNYQISQYDLPLSRDGYIEIGDRRIGIRRVHLEEDAGKLIHKGASSLVDFNRAGVPLLEIVSEPDITSPEEAYAYLTSLKSILEYLDVSDCDMEKGSLRCDANISLRPKGSGALGVKSELKNMNSFKGVKDALAYEIERQARVLAEGETLVQETRLWDAQRLQTFPMRTKEEAQDYRYFPEPDLPPFLITAEKISQIRSEIPELPKDKQMRFMKEYGLSAYDAGILVAGKKDALYAEESIKAYPGEDKKPVVNWLTGALLAEANSRGCGLGGLNVPVAELAELVGYVERQEISNLSAKAVLKEMIDCGAKASEIIKRKNLIQISDAASLESAVEEAISQNPGPVQDYRLGKGNAIMFLVGQVMRKTAGRANPKVVQEILKRRLTDA